MKKIIYFSAPWCAPCRMLGPVMDSIAEQLPVEKINVDEDTELAAKYSIRNVPTLLFIKDGVVYNKLVGNQTDTSILAAYNG